MEGPEKKEEMPKVEIIDTRPLGVQAMEDAETILTEPVMGLTHLLQKYNCKHFHYIPAEGVEFEKKEVWESHIGEDGEEKWDYEDYHSERIPHEYFLVQDAIKRDICVINISPGEMLNTDPYVCDIKYIGPPEEETHWKPLIEEIQYMRIA